MNMKGKDLKRRIKSGCKKAKKFVSDHKYACYAFYNTFGVAVPDIIAMNNTDWSFATNPDAGLFGITPYDYYKVFFLGIIL